MLGLDGASAARQKGGLSRSRPGARASRRNALGSRNPSYAQRSCRASLSTSLAHQNPNRRRHPWIARSQQPPPFPVSPGTLRGFRNGKRGVSVINSKSDQLAAKHMADAKDDVNI